MGVAVTHSDTRDHVTRTTHGDRAYISEGLLRLYRGDEEVLRVRPEQVSMIEASEDPGGSGVSL